MPLGATARPTPRDLSASFAQASSKGRETPPSIDTPPVSGSSAYLPIGLDPFRLRPFVAVAVAVAVAVNVNVNVNDHGYVEDTPCLREPPPQASMKLRASSMGES